MFIAEHLSIVEKFYKQYERITNDIPHEEINVDSYYLPVTLDVVFETFYLMKLFIHKLIYYHPNTHSPSQELFFVQHCAPLN